MKECFKCQVLKPFTDFYKHKGMADGHLGKCKECTKRDVSENYRDKIDQYKEYYRTRSASGYRKEEKREYLKAYRSKYPERDQAHYLVYKAIKNGDLIPQPCFICGKTAEAHHPDYTLPLEVVWLCSQHHHEVHNMVPF